jgi:hypothetical protein
MSRGNGETTGFSMRDLETDEMCGRIKRGYMDI